MMYSDLPAVATVEATAALLGTSPDTVYKLVSAGELGHVRLGRSIRICRHHLVTFLTRDAVEVET